MCYLSDEDFEVIICKCGSMIAASKDPEDKDWKKEVRTYEGSGCEIKTVTHEEFHLMKFEP